MLREFAATIFMNLRQCSLSYYCFVRLRVNPYCCAPRVWNRGCRFRLFVFVFLLTEISGSSSGPWTEFHLLRNLPTAFQQSPRNPIPRPGPRRGLPATANVPPLLASASNFQPSDVGIPVLAVISSFGK